MEELQKLLNMVSGADGTTADVTGYLPQLSPEKLAEMEAAAISAFTEIRKDPNFGRGDKGKLETIAAATDLIRSEMSGRSESEQKLFSEVDKLTERIMAPYTNSSTTPADNGGEPAAPAEGDNGGDGGPATDATTSAAADLAPVAASAVTRERVDLASVKAHQPAVLQAATNDPGKGVCLASADVPGFGTGWVIRDDAELARAITSRFAGMPLGTTNVGPISAGVAQYERRMQPELVASSQRSLDKALDFACDEKSLPGGSLVAAASSCGWCSPPERDWTLCTPLETDAGMLTLPAVTVNRGGLEFTANTPWWQIYQSVPDQVLTVPGFVCDKADGTPCEPLDPCPPDKTCITIPCPTWNKCIPKVSVLCIEAPILMNEAWPEAITQFVGRARMAFRRRANARYLAQMAATILAAQGGTPYAAIPSIGAAGAVFDTVAAQAMWYRDLNKMDPNATLQVVAPIWLREVIRADLAKRDGCGCEPVTDARITAEFAVLNVAVSWVYDWQPLAAVSGAPAAPVKITGWPASVDLMMFPFGTFALGLSNVITLNAVYDSTNLKKNVFTELFMEDKWCLIQRCYDAMLLRVPICVQGGTGPRIDLCPAPPAP